MSLSSKQTIVDKVIDVELKNEIGDFLMGAYQISDNNNISEVIIIYFGSIDMVKNVRINSACYTADIFGCKRCDCNEQLKSTLTYFKKEKNGLLLYLLNQDGMGNGTVKKLKSLKKMDEEVCSTYEAYKKINCIPDLRNYSSVVTILKDLKINEVNLITNNPNKVEFLLSNGINVKSRIPCVSKNKKIIQYLINKKRDFNHIIELGSNKYD